MGILRNLFGSLTSGLIRLAVLGGILLLAYLLIVKPALKSTDEALHSTGLDRIGKTLDTVGVQVQREIRRAFELTKAQGGHPERLIHCVKHAHQDVEKIERCTRRF